REVQSAEERRRRRVVVAATGSVLLALALGVVASTILALRERAARQEAARHGEEATPQARGSGELTNVLLSMADPEKEPTRRATPRKAVDRVAENLDEGSFEAPETKARLCIQLGKIYFNLGEYRRSRDLFAEAYRIAGEKLGDGNPTALSALDQLGKAH